MLLIIKRQVKFLLIIRNNSIQMFCLYAIIIQITTKFIKEKMYNEKKR